MLVHKWIWINLHGQSCPFVPCRLRLHFVLSLLSRFVITEWYGKTTGQYYKGHGLTAHLEGRREAVDV